MKEKKLNTYIKMNPTLLGKKKLDEILKSKGYDILLPEETFKHDIDINQAITIIQNCKKEPKIHLKENIILSEEKLNKMKQRMKLLIVNYMKKQVFQKKILILLVY